MKSIQALAALAVLSLTSVLTACGGGGGSSGSSANDEVAPAAMLLSATNIEMEADGAKSATLSIFNTSASTTATDIYVVLPATWTDVKQDASNCAKLAPQSTCSIVFSPGTVQHPSTGVQVRGKNLVPAHVMFSVVGSSTATIEITPATLDLEAGSSAVSTLLVTNKSSAVTAHRVEADLSGIPWSSNVFQDASDCIRIAPGASCSLRFMAGRAAISQTRFPVGGTNTKPAGAAIGVSLPTAATLKISGSPLILYATEDIPVVGSLTVTNTSTIVTARDVSAQLQGTALSGLVVQDSSSCATLVPGASCTLTFAPNRNVVANTSVVVQGSNASMAPVTIAVNPRKVWLSISPQPIELIRGGMAKGILVRNDSAEIAYDIRPDFANTPLAGYAWVSENQCAVLAPSSHCSIYFSPGNFGVSPTSFTIAGVNTEVTTTQLSVRDLAVGDPHAGGTVFRLPTSSQSGLVVSTAERFLPWQHADLSTGATSETDGRENTEEIVGIAGATNDYAAGYCDAYAVQYDGVTLSDWYLPADEEFVDLLREVAEHGGPIRDLFRPRYWTSTEASSSTANTFGIEGAWLPRNKSEWNYARCIRSFN